MDRAETERFVERLRNRGVEVEYELFEDEAHGVRSGENRIRLYSTALEFLDKHLKPKPQ